LQVKPTAEEDHEQGGKAKKCPERELVAAGDGPAKRRGGAEATTIRTDCDGGLPTADEECNNEKKADEAAKKCAKEKRKKRALDAEESADHQHHLHVAHTHTFAAACKFVERGGSKKKKTACCGAQERASDADDGSVLEKKGEVFDESHTSGIGGRNSNGEGNSQAETKPVYGVRENADSNVSDCQDDDKAQEKEPFKRFGRKAKREIAGDEEQASEKFDSGIHYGDWCAAVAAFAAEREPGDQWNVVVRLDGRAAVRAARTGRHDGHAIRDPRYADVQKAADN